MKRIYESSESTDGFRVLVDRLWPRGVSKNEAKIDLWLKEIAPSESLRKWFNHEEKKWNEFQKKYKEELNKNEDLLEQLKNIEKENKVVTLLFSAKDEVHNNAIVLLNILTR